MSISRPSEVDSPLVTKVTKMYPDAEPLKTSRA